MASPIKKQKEEKKVKITIAVVVGIIWVYIALLILHAGALTRDNPRLSFMDGVGMSVTRVFTHPGEIFPLNKTLLLFIAIGSALALAAIWIVINNNKLRKHDDPNKVLGSERFMTEDDLKEFNTKRNVPYGDETVKEENNYLLADGLYMGYNGSKTRRNLNTVVFGGSGAGKTRFFVAPNILQFNTNLVITDPNGEIYEDYAKALENHGYEILVFNLTDIAKTNRYNPFCYIKNENDIFTMINAIIKNTTPKGSSSGDVFWEKSEMLLLSALCLLIWHTFDKEEQTFTNLMALLPMAEIDENDSTVVSKLDLMFEKLKKVDETNLAVRQYEQFKLGAGKTLKSILISVSARLNIFNLASIKYLMSKDELNFETFADNKKALFIITPTTDTTFNFIVSNMYSQLFTTLYRYAEKRAEYGWHVKTKNGDIIKVFQAKDKEDSVNAKKEAEEFVKKIKEGTHIQYDKTKSLYKLLTKDNTLIAFRGEKEWIEEVEKSFESIYVESQKGKRALPHHVMLMLDEFANIGQIPDFPQIISTIRKYKISTTIILQTLSQLKALYKDDKETILGNCDIKVFLGSSDPETKKYFSEELGNKTVVVENMSFNGNGNGSTSYSRQKMPLMSPSQLETELKDDECIIKVRGDHPYFGKKYELTNHKNYEYAESVKGMHTLITDEEELKGVSISIPIKQLHPDIMTEISEVKGRSKEEDKEELKNRIRKEQAKEEEEMQQKFNEKADIGEENLVEILSSVYGLDDTATPDQIKEMVETMVTIERVENEEDLSFAMEA